MVKNELTPEQAKTLKLFSYYCQSYGGEEVTLHLYLYTCTVDYFEKYWNKGFGEPIEAYDELTKTIEEIVESVLDDIDMDCDNNGNLEIYIDCKERKIKIEVQEYVMVDHESGDSKEFVDSDERIDSIFNHMKEYGFKEGVVEFNGGGDSGEIYDTIDYGNGEQEKIEDSSVTNYLYDWLESFYGGWEINEGSHGYFRFYSETKTIDLEFYEHREVTEDRGTIFYAEF